MHTTTTTPQAPAFATIAGEGWTDKGARALLYLMREGQYASWRLDDDTVEAAYHGAGVAATARGTDEYMAEQLARLQLQLRGTVARRQAERDARDARLQALFDQAAPAVDQAPAVDDQGPAAGQGGGGSKVPKAPRPDGMPPADGAMLPAPVVVPAPMLQAVPALSPAAAGDWF